MEGEGSPFSCSSFFFTALLKRKGNGRNGKEGDENKRKGRNIQEMEGIYNREIKEMEAEIYNNY